MSNLLKEEVFKFIFIFIIISALDYFFQWIKIGTMGTLGISTGCVIYDLILYFIKKRKCSNNIQS